VSILTDKGETVKHVETFPLVIRSAVLLLGCMHLYANVVPTFAETGGASSGDRPVGAQQEPPAADEAEMDGPWIDLIAAEGAAGIAKIGKNLTVCGDVQLGPNAKNLTAVPGDGVIAALSKLKVGGANNLLSRKEFGDCEVQLEFLIGKGSNSGVKLQQRYEIQLFDSFGKSEPTAKDCGGVYPHWKFRGRGKGLNYIDEGIPPRSNAAKPAGQWQTLRIVFRAPRFDSSGKKAENARFDSVVLNGITIHENVELDSPTGNASQPMRETSRGPLLLQLDHGAVAFRNVRVRTIAGAPAAMGE
jgi:hypothetical protein